MLNVTRLYNASSAIGSMNRLYSIVVNYSTKRKAFGKELINQPAH
jgi:alkylation response protein AidB-like acyl-CoA dehydrogenase